MPDAFDCPSFFLERDFPARFLIRAGKRWIGVMANADFVAVYGKSEKANLSKAEQSMMAKVVSTIVQSYPRGRGTK